MSTKLMRFTLSAENPVVVSQARYTEAPPAPVFDMHYDLEMGVVLHGRMKRFLGDTGVERGAGEAWLCGMWETHGFDIVEAPCEVVVVVIWPPLLAGQRFPQVPELSLLAPFTLPARQRLSQAPALAEEVLRLGQRIAATAAGAGAARAVRLQLQVSELLVRLWEGRASTKGAPGVASPDAFHRLTPALSRVFAARGAVATDAAARLCGMSTRQFSRVFRNLMGITFSRFATCQRLHRAADALVNTDEPVKTVAAEWGFVDASHLHRLFLKHYGCSPATYRARRRNQEPG
jgi:AraC-like DNA-binding protein